jgi:hypothetical protein
LNNDEEIKLKVCGNCDAPLPCLPKELNYFKEDENL